MSQLEAPPAILWRSTGTYQQPPKAKPILQSELYNVHAASLFGSPLRKWVISSQLEVEMYLLAVGCQITIPVLCVPRKPYALNNFGVN